MICPVFVVLLMESAGPVGTVEKPDVLFGFSKQRWKSSRKKMPKATASDFHGCGSFRRPPLLSFFASFSFFAPP